jgi:uncharacterized membrane protein required for colicin V production
LSLLFRFDSLRDYILILIFLVINIIVMALFLFVITATLIFGERGALDSLGGGLTVGYFLVAYCLSRCEKEFVQF